MKQTAKEALAEQPFPISTEYITLGQLLKMAGVIGTGGQAKFYLEDTIIKINGAPEQRRGRKIYPGDKIVIPDHPPLCVVVGEAESEEEDE